MAQTVAQRTPVSKAFYGFLDTEHGIFTLMNGVVVFMASETEELRIVERGMTWQVCGEVGIADCQQLLDRMHGGYAAVATSRQQEVQ
jgi:hypothetical protein